MSKDWVKDLSDMHTKFGFKEWIEENKHNKDLMKSLIEFRIKFLIEELTETLRAFETNDSEEFVDGLIDLCVVAIGTLDFFELDTYKAWDEVHAANMSKKAGVKPNRPNPLGIPDLIKPIDWVGPSHEDNHGYLKNIMS